MYEPLRRKILNIAHLQQQNFSQLAVIYNIMELTIPKGKKLTAQRSVVNNFRSRHSLLCLFPRFLSFFSSSLPLFQKTNSSLFLLFADLQHSCIHESIKDRELHNVKVNMHGQYNMSPISFMKDKKMNKNAETINGVCKGVCSYQKCF